LKLEPLSKQDVLLKFLRNANNAKTLVGLVQELAGAIADYQVRAATLCVIFNELLARSQYNKEWMRGWEAPVIPTTSAINLRTSMVNPGISTVTLRTSLIILMIILRISW